MKHLQIVLEGAHDHSDKQATFGFGRGIVHRSPKSVRGGDDSPGLLVPKSVFNIICTCCT